jgi:hypothetical protein
MHNLHKSVDNLVKTGHNKRKLSTPLTKVLRFSRAGEPLAVSSKARRNAFGLSLCLAAFSMQTMPLNAATLTDHYKLYLHSKVISEKQYICALYVGFIESRWNTQSRNGDHYGLFQMRNNKVKYMNGYQQIDLWLKYVNHRYHGSTCNAMQHLKDKGWQ